MASPVLAALVYFALFASGAAALIYQIAWTRVLTISLGATVYAVSAVLAGFMTGLAVGSRVLGGVADRSMRPLVLYGVLELLVAIYAVGFVAGTPYLQQLFAQLQTGAGGRSPWAWPLALALAAGLVSLPAFMMGGTLPALARSLAAHPATGGLRLARLYGWNTLGAVAGCLAQAGGMVLWVGVQGSILFAAAINLLAAAVALALALLAKCNVPGRSAAQSREPQRMLEQDAPATTGAGRFRDSARLGEPGYNDESDIGPTTGRPTRRGGKSPDHCSQRMLAAVAVYSGFATLAVEVLWTRLFINFLTGNVLVFAALLAAFLSGLAVASLLVGRYGSQRRAFQPALGIALLGSAGWLVVSALLPYPLAMAFDFAQRTFAMGGTGYKTLACLAIMWAAVSVPTLTMGYVFPLLMRQLPRAGEGWHRSVGRDTGRLLAWNTVGAIAGSCCAGLLLLPVVGLRGSLLLVAAGYTGLAAWIGNTGCRRLATAATVACLTLVALPQFRRPVFWLNQGFTTGLTWVEPGDTLFLEESAESTVGVARLGTDLALAVNGLIVAETSPDDLWDLLLKAHLPMLLHPAPKKVALVGLGGGVSLGAVESYDDVEQIDCVELSAGVERAHRLFSTFNDRCWEDERLRLRINDGRHFLLVKRERYDVISVDPVDPPVCNLYTQDFFQLCHDRLAPRGLMVQWLPLFRLEPVQLKVVMRAFLNVFEHTTLWYDGTSVLLIGGRDAAAIQIDIERFWRRAHGPRVQENLRKIGSPGPVLLLSTYAMGPEALEDFVGRNLPPNTDDVPYLEFVALRAAHVDSHTRARNLEMLLALNPDEVFGISGAPTAKLAAIRRARQMMRELVEVRIQLLRGETAAALAQLERLGRQYEWSRTSFDLLRPFVGGSVTWEEFQ